MLFVTVSSGIMDHWVLSEEQRKHPRLQLLVWFSPVRNLQKLILSRSDDELTCVHGIRFFTMSWIIIGHTLEWNNLNAISTNLFVNILIFKIIILLVCKFN